RPMLRWVVAVFTGLHSLMKARVVLRRRISLCAIRSRCKNDCAEETEGDSPCVMSIPFFCGVFILTVLCSLGRTSYWCVVAVHSQPELDTQVELYEPIVNEHLEVKWATI